MPATVVIAIASAAAVTAFSAAAFTFAAFATNLAITAGLALLSYLLTPKPKIGTLDSTVTRTQRSAVAPARWILGRARVAGQMVYYEENVSPGARNGECYVALVLSEGSCDSIEKIWIDSTEIPFTRTSRTGGDKLTPLDQGDFHENYNGKLEVYEYFKADGTQGAELRTAVSSSKWSAMHKLNGKSWVYVKLTQPAYSSKSTAGRFWTKFPEITFLVKGLKITWPGQTTPVWTESAAALRYWWLRNRRGVPAAAIDSASVIAAHTLCSAVLDHSSNFPDSGYETATKTVTRYSINGVVQSEDDPEAVEKFMDFAWQGYALEVDGVYIFRPGADRAATVTLNEENIVAVEEVSPAPSLQDRINSATVTLSQSRDHDWLNYGVPEVVDQPALTRDGERLPVDFQTTPFVADPLTGARLLAIALRRARGSATFSYRVMPGDMFELFGLIPTDRVLVNDSNYGLVNFRAQIVATTINDDWSVTLSLIEDLDGVYADTFVLPALKPREIGVTNPRSVATVSNLALDETVEHQDDGTVLVTLDVSWTAKPIAETEVQYRVQKTSQAAEAGWRSLFTESDSIEIPNVLVGVTYEVRAKHIYENGLASSWTALASRLIGGDLTAPGAITGLTVTGIRGGYEATWTNPSDSDLGYVEVTDGSTQFSASRSVRGRVSSNHFMRANIGTPTALWVGVRPVDRSGNRGSITQAQVTTQAPGVLLSEIPRGPRDFSVVTTASSWSDTLANTATPGNNVVNDQVTQYKVDGSYIETRYWTGSAWTAVDRRIDGNLLIRGSVGANQLSVGSITAGKIAAGAINAADLIAPGVVNLTRYFTASENSGGANALDVGSFTLPTGGNYMLLLLMTLRVRYNSGGTSLSSFSWPTVYLRTYKNNVHDSTLGLTVSSLDLTDLINQDSITLLTRSQITGGTVIKFDVSSWAGYRNARIDRAASVGVVGFLS